MTNITTTDSIITTTDTEASQYLTFPISLHIKRSDLAMANTPQLRALLVARTIVEDMLTNAEDMIDFGGNNADDVAMYQGMIDAHANTLFWLDHEEEMANEQAVADAVERMLVN